MVNSLKQVNLGDIGKIITGKTPSTKSEGNFGYKYFFITPRDITNQRMITYTERKLSDAGKDSVKNCLIPAKSICVTCIGSDMGKVVMTTGESVTNQQINSIVPNETIVNPYYLYYYLKPMKDYLKSMAGGTTMPILNKSDFSNLEIKLPSLEVQNKAAEILSSLDDKIELNIEMNKTLEEMVLSTFKSWFIDFELFKEEKYVESELGLIPSEWKVGYLGELIEVNPKTLMTKEEEYKFVDMANVPSSSARVNEVNIRKFTGGGSRFQNDDIIFARITPCLENGKTAIIDFLNKGESAFGSTEFLVFRGIGWNAMYFGYCLSRYDGFRKYAVQHMNGSSGRQRVSKGDIENYRLVVPPQKILLEFNTLVSCYFEKMKQNDLQNATLKEIRDLILPKLVSGEIDIKSLNNISKINI